MNTEYQGVIAGEEWRAIPGYEGEYEASSYGRVRSLDRITRGGKRWKGRVLSIAENGAGYLLVTMPQNDDTRTGRAQGVHRLVCLAFEGEAPTPDHIVNHKDGDRHNNRPANLEWATRSENMTHARDVLGRKYGQKGGEAHTHAVLTAGQVLEIRARWDAGPRYYGQIAALAKEFQTSSGAIHAIVRRNTWKGDEYEPAQPLYQGQGNASTQGAYTLFPWQFTDITR